MDTIDPIVHFIVDNNSGHLDMVILLIKDKDIVSNFIIIIEDIEDILIVDITSHIMVED